MHRSGIVNGKLYGPYRRARWSLTIGRPYVEGLVAFLNEEGISTAPCCLQPKTGTAVFEMASQDAIRAVAERMYRDGSLWLDRKKRIFDTLGVVGKCS